MTEEQHLAFIKQCEVYIGDLKSQNKLIAAQPIERVGMVIRKPAGVWFMTPSVTDDETQVGYYHIFAEDLDAAVKIAQDNPEFAFVPTASIEVRPIKTKESETGFVYPTGFENK